MKLLIRLKEGTFTLADATAADYLRGKDHHADYMVAFELGEFAFADRLHDSVSCDEVQIFAVANQKAGVAKFVDETRCAIGCIEYRLQRVFLKNGLGTIRSAQFFLDIIRERQGAGYCLTAAGRKGEPLPGHGNPSQS